MPPNFIVTNNDTDGNLTVINSVGPREPGVTPMGELEDVDSTTTIISDSADLQILKVCKPDLPSRLSAGEPALCTITVKNNGNSWARNVKLTDSISHGAGTSIIPPQSYTFSPASDPTPTVRTCTPDPAPASSTDNPYVINCNLGDIPDPSDDTGGMVTLTYEFSSNDTTDINNTATVLCQSNPDEATGGGTPDPNCDNNTANGSIGITASADLRIIKTLDAPGPFTAGDHILYELAINNFGPSAAKNIYVTDYLPFGVGAQIVGGGCSGTSVITLGTAGNPSDPLVFKIDDLASGSSCTATIDVIVQPNATGTLTNKAVVESTTPDPTLANNMSSIGVDVLITDVEIEKTAVPDPIVLAGKELLYTLKVSNLGQSIATDTTVIDTLPDEVSYLADTGGCISLDPVTFSCGLGDINPGKNKTFTIKTKVNSDAVVDIPSQTLVITNFADVSTATSDNDPSNNSVEKSTFVEAESDLQVIKQCKPDTSNLLAGEIGTCKMTVTNNGPSDARNVELTDSLLSNGTFEIIDVIPSQGTCNPDPDGSTPGTGMEFDKNATVDCDLGNLSAIKSDGMNVATVEILLTSKQDVDIDDIADVDSETDDPKPENNTWEGSLGVDGLADLSVMKSDSPDPVVAGTDLSYEITVHNDGPSDAVNVVVSDVIPAGVIIKSITPSKGNCNAGVPGNPLLPTECALDTMADGDTETITIVVTVKPDTTGTIFNDVTVSSKTLDENNQNNFWSEPTTITPQADLQVTKTVTTPSGGGGVAAGGDLVWTVTIHNAGPSTATGIQLYDEIPDTVNYISYQILQGSGLCAATPAPGVKFTCTFGDLPPNKDIVLLISTKVKIDVPDATNIENCVLVTSDHDPDSAPTYGSPVENDNESCVDIDSTVAADLWMEKDSNFPTGNPSSTVQYFCIVHNNAGCSKNPSELTPWHGPGNVCGTGGPSDATNVVIKDKLPLDSKKVSVQYVSPGCSYNKSSHEVTCNNNRIKVGDVVTYEIQVAYKGSQKTDLLNRCYIYYSATPDPDTTNNDHIIRTVVQGGTGSPPRNR